MQNEVCKWAGWIPTNKGEIDFNYIELPENIEVSKGNFEINSTKKEFKNLDVSYLSDSYGYKHYLKYSSKKPTESKIIANVLFEKVHDKIIGNAQIEYVKFVTIKTKFEIEKNGVVLFDGLEASQSISGFEKEIKTLLYVLAKTIVHSDAHHHQKIDIALDISDGDFQPNVVSKSFLNYIKLAEKNTKKTNNCESILRNENIVFEIEGYFSYFESFCKLFETEQTKTDKEFAKNVINSLKNTVAKRKNKEIFTSSIITTAIAFFGILVTVNLLLNGFWIPTSNELVCFFNEQNRYYYFLATLVFVLLLFFHATKCKLKSYVYYHYYEQFEFIKLLKNTSFGRLNWYGKLIKLSPIVLIGVGILLMFLVN